MMNREARELQFLKNTVRMSRIKYGLLTFLMSCMVWDMILESMIHCLSKSIIIIKVFIAKDMRNLILQYWSFVFTLRYNIKKNVWGESVNFNSLKSAVLILLRFLGSHYNPAKSRSVEYKQNGNWQPWTIPHLWQKERKVD